MFAIKLAMVYATTNLKINIDVFCRIVAGYVFEGKVLANLWFFDLGYISGIKGLQFAQDLKLGLYCNIPARSLFLVQLVGLSISTLSQVGVVNWALNHIPDICTTAAPNGFTCPFSRTHFNTSIIWGAIGPRRFFSPGSTYHGLLDFFLLGSILPVGVWLLKRRRPGGLWRHVHVPLFLGGLNYIPPASGTNYGSWAVVGLVFGVVVKRRARTWWRKGIRIVFQYTNYLGDTSPETNNSILAVPERHADMMKFGIITTPYFDRSLVMVNPKDSVKDVCTRSLRNLGLMDNLLHTNADESLDDLRIKYFLNDVLGFLMDYIPNEPSEKIRTLGCRLMLHFPYPWKLESPTSLIVGHTCLAKFLHAHIETMDSSSQAKASLEELYQVIERIRSLSPFDWKNKMAQYRRSAEYHLLDYYKNFKMTQPSESFPQHKEEISPNGDRTSKSYKRYKDLISCHFSSLYYNGNREKGRLTEEEKDPNRYDIGGPYNQECLEWSLVYVKNVPEVVKRMRWMGYEDADQVIVAWWRMIVRGMLWFLPHQMGDPSPPDVDASWWDSNLPV
ncbi:hypothetical protein SLS57_008662 [Botryosphaeria dothidea]